MNKMAKGAIATGVGVILLAGGGGTLATWNQANSAAMGSVVSGDLNLVPVAKSAVWTNASGNPIDITTYKVVPGDSLTYTQQLNVTLSGDLMVAKLAVTGAAADKGFGANAVVSATRLSDSKGGAVLKDDKLTPANTGVVTASTTFAFKESTTARNSVNSTVDFSSIGYKLEQQAPAGSNGL
ncbi:alternate-type signal peptide domain-containing protein [Arthrobacter sp. TMN-49]